MEDISQLLAPQQGTSSTPAFVLTLVALLLGGSLMSYLLYCYLQERRIRKRVQRRVCQAHGGNIVPPEAMVTTHKPLSETRRLRRRSGVLPLPRSPTLKVRRRPHPWKHNRLRVDPATPH